MMNFKEEKMKLSFVNFGRVTTAAGCLMLFLPACVAAAEIRFLATDALESSVKELLPEFEKATGHRVDSSIANAGVIAERVRKEDAADLAIVLPPQWEGLRQEGKIDAAVRVVIGKVGIGVFAKKGAARPDISTVDTFKRSMLNAHAVGLRDPAARSPVGTYVLALFERLGIAQEMKPKVVLTMDRPYETILQEKADFGFSTLAEIAATPEVELIGPLPADLQTFNIFTTAVPVTAKETGAVKQLIDFLKSDRARSVLKSKGIDIEG
jgi:molybdate transport system substrate-binding protein